MTAQPITSAETVLVEAIAAALNVPRLFYQRADSEQWPVYVFQFQSDISRLDWVGDTAATCLMTLKAFSDTSYAARAALEAVLPGMDTIAASGYTMKAHYDRAIPIPPQDNVWQSACLFRITLERN